MLTLSDLDRICPLPPEPGALPRVLGRHHLIALGYSTNAIRHRIENGSWRRVLPRTYLTSDVFTDRDRFVAALIFAGRGAALSGAAALVSSDVRGVRMPTRVLVLVAPSNRTRSNDWVQVRRTHRPIDTVRWTGPRRVEVPRAAADLALTMEHIGDVRALVARVVQDRHGTVEELSAELESGPQNGSGHLRRALTEVGWGAASAPEAEAATILRRAGITGFVQNATIRLPNGSTRVIDFYWARLRACLEIDSIEWHLGVREWAGTWDRHLELTSNGHSVIHRPPSALKDQTRFVADVRAWLAGREAELRRGLT